MGALSVVNRIVSCFLFTNPMVGASTGRITRGMSKEANGTYTERSMLKTFVQLVGGSNESAEQLRLLLLSTSGFWFIKLPLDTLRLVDPSNP